MPEMTIDAETRRRLKTFLDAAAGDGLECGGVDAAQLYAAVFYDEHKDQLARLQATVARLEQKVQAQ